MELKDYEQNNNNQEENKEQKKNEDKGDKIVVFVIGSLYILFFAIRVIIQLPKCFDDSYKAIWYAIEENGHSRADDFRVYRNDENKTIKYTINFEDCYFDKIVSSYSEYLKNHPSNICNNGYSISLVFNKEISRHDFNQLEVCNYIDGDIHEDFDVIDVVLDSYHFYTYHFNNNPYFDYKYLFVEDGSRSYRVVDNPDFEAYEYIGIFNYFENLKEFRVSVISTKMLYKIDAIVHEKSPDCTVINLYKDFKNSFSLEELYTTEKLDEIYIKEAGRYEKYIMLNNNKMSSGIALMRAKPLEEAMYFYSDSSRKGTYSYANSYIDKYLENNLYNSFSEGLKSEIKNVPLTDIVRYERYVENKEEYKAIYRHVFILSSKEYKDLFHWGLDNVGEHNFTNLGLINIDTWTRTFRDYDLAFALSSLLPNGSNHVSSYKTDTLKSVQPVIVLNPAATAKYSPDIIQGETVLILECDK